MAKLSAASALPGETEKQCDGPRLLLTCLDSGLSVQHVSCGLEHSVFLTRHGTVLTCGSGRYECLDFHQVIFKLHMLFGFRVVGRRKSQRGNIFFLHSCLSCTLSL